MYLAKKYYKMLDKIIQENYNILRDKAMQAGLKITPNKQLIEDLFHNILLSMLGNKKLLKMELDEIKAYIYRSIQINYIRELKYSRNSKIIHKQKLEEI